MRVSLAMVLALVFAGCSQKEDGRQFDSDYGDRCEMRDGETDGGPKFSWYRVGRDKQDVFRAVAVMRMSDESVCSAVLIAPDRLLTAAHCFDDGNSIASLEFRESSDSAKQSAVKATRIHPDYALFYQRGYRLASHPQMINADLAVTQLRSPVKDRLPVAFGSSFMPVSGALLAVVGYGDAGVGAGARRFSWTNLGRIVEEGDKFVSGFLDVLVLDSKSMGGACPGDSGGGIFWQTSSGEFQLVGIVSGINNLIYPGLPADGCSMCPQGLGLAKLVTNFELSWEN